LLDVANRQVVLDDERVALTALEFGVLRCLLAHKRKAVSRATLIEQAWGHS
jgi:DNA-binding response OmpR family regulator